MEEKSDDEQISELKTLALRFHTLFLEMKDPLVRAALQSRLNAIAPSADTFATILAQTFYGNEVFSHLHFVVYHVPTLGATIGFLPRLYTREGLLDVLSSTAEYVKSLPPQFFSLAPQPSVN